MTTAKKIREEIVASKKSILRTLALLNKEIAAHNKLCRKQQQKINIAMRGHKIDAEYRRLYQLYFAAGHELNASKIDPNTVR